MTRAAQLLQVNSGAGGYSSFKLPTGFKPALVLYGHRQKGPNSCQG